MGTDETPRRRRGTQYPLRPADRPYDVANVERVRYKPDAGKLEMTMPIEEERTKSRRGRGGAHANFFAAVDELEREGGGARRRSGRGHDT